MPHLPISELARQAGLTATPTSPGRVRLSSPTAPVAVEIGEDFAAANLERFLVEGFIEGRIAESLRPLLLREPLPFRSIIEPAPVPPSVKEFQDSTDCLDCVTRAPGIEEQRFITLPAEERKIAGPIFRVTSTAIRPRTLFLILLAIVGGGYVLSR